MRPTTSSSPHRWDGTPTRPRRPRALRIASHSPTRLLRTAQRTQCAPCGNLIEQYARIDHEPIALHPAELPAAAVPPAHRWHVASGLAHPAHDGTPWCRLTHLLLCPAQSAPADLTPPLNELRRCLALRTRHLLDTGALTHPTPAPATTPARDCRPERPVIQAFHLRYLAARPLQDLQCVAQTRTRTRCTHPVLDPHSLPGRWILLPAAPRHRQLSLPHTLMAIYDLTHLPSLEQQRWRAQRCTTHATTPTAADLALSDWELFDPLLHHAHIHNRLPTTARPAHHP